MMGRQNKMWSGGRIRRSEKNNRQTKKLTGGKESPIFGN
jgi:hypothetical protein